MSRPGGNSGRLERPQTQLDRACIDVAMRMAERMYSDAGSPLHAVLIVPVWRNDGDPGYKAGPALLGKSDALDFLCATLRDVATRIEAGEFIDIGDPDGVNCNGGSG